MYNLSQRCCLVAQPSQLLEFYLKPYATEKILAPLVKSCLRISGDAPISVLRSFLSRKLSYERSQDIQVRLKDHSRACFCVYLLTRRPFLDCHFHKWDGCGSRRSFEATRSARKPLHRALGSAHVTVLQNRSYSRVLYSTGNRCLTHSRVGFINAATS
jgi:hypothetical protein